ncbi:DUF58 domain-containing protein [Rhodoferax sp.]|uniref:DUF58 domain-containing protein n=1 Tax=Rhodoferax sp. TaxID=50421 RepID=UPI001A107C0C|nr:DUF58 domain-containing protein [Rhodoferax sp.]MBE0473221.1 DUF58 domain-containing protein [Rhodoferax sp.]
MTPTATLPAANNLLHPWRHPLASVRARVARWWQSRLPLADSITLTQRNVYIMPTRAGLMLGVTLLVLLIAAINYQLNLGYLLTFLLAGSALVGMHVGHGTLRGLTLNLTAPEAIHLGSKAVFSIHLHNARKRTRYGIGLAVLGAGQWAWTDVAGQASATVQLAFRPERRGRHRLPTLTAETRFPLGTFRVWTLWRPAAQVLVYPAPEVPAAPLPEGQAHEGSAHASAISVQGEPDGLRAYRRGDALKTIVWKKAAKTGELVSRDRQTLQQQTLWLDQQHTGLAQPEAQLSRLCAWVLQAEQLGLIYGLHLKNHDIAPGSGPAHQQRCLQALALA